MLAQQLQLVVRVEPQQQQDLQERPVVRMVVLTLQLQDQKHLALALLLDVVLLPQQQRLVRLQLPVQRQQRQPVLQQRHVLPQHVLLRRLVQQRQRQPVLLRQLVLPQHVLLRRLVQRQHVRLVHPQPFGLRAQLLAAVEQLVPVAVEVEVSALVAAVVEVEASVQVAEAAEVVAVPVVVAAEAVEVADRLNNKKGGPTTTFFYALASLSMRCQHMCRIEQFVQLLFA